ncbi:MAG: hypothetical protein QMB51_02075, partial [Patescibacteria group bacterium]
MFKKPILKFILATGLVAIVILPSISFAKTDTTLTKYYGKVLVETDNKSKIWYVDPLKKEKYPLNSESDAVDVMKKVGVGISNKDINRIKLPTSKYSNWRDYTFAKNLSGRIFVQVQDKGQAWYIDPINFRKYYLGSGKNALNILKSLSIKAKSSEINKIKTGTISLATVNPAGISNGIQDDKKEVIIVPDTKSLSLSVNNSNGASGSVTMIQNDQNITYTKKDFVKTYVVNSEVILYPVADYGYKFIGWGGDCFQNSDINCKLTVNKDLNVIAYFSTITPVYSNSGYSGGGSTSPVTTTPTTTPTTPSITKYNLNISKLGSGNGYITNSVNSNHFNGSQEYNIGTQITLTVSPNSDSVFLGWTGDVCSGNSTTCSFSINSNISVMANFALKPRITLIQAVGGNIIVNPSKEYFEENELATITATPSNGYTFTKWLGDCSNYGSSSTCTLTMNGSKTVSALFGSNIVNVPTVNLTLAQTTGGSISSAKTTYSLNESATITATPSNGYTFTKWLG